MKKNSKILLLPLIVLLVLLGTSSMARSFELNGFGDVTFTSSTETNNNNGAFALGGLDLYVSQPIDDKTEVVVEFVIEADATGESKIDLERLQLRYLVNDALKLHAGRFHNILGYWNTAFHHGTLLHTSIGRPAFLEFEDGGGILPSHLIGLWASGRYKTDPLSLTYGVMAGNGSKVQDGGLNPNNNSDNNGNKAVSFRLTAEPVGIPGLMFGLSGSYAVVKGYTTSLTGEVMEVMRVKQSIAALDITYFEKPFEFLAEYYLILDKDDFSGSEKYSSNAFYIQGGYVINDLFIPYARYEQVSLDDKVDPYFSALGTTESKRTLAGMRYNLSVSNAVKAEVRFIDNGTEKFKEYAVQWAVAF